jgi:hypothetical protein
MFEMFIDMVGALQPLIIEVIEQGLTTRAELISLMKGDQNVDRTHMGDGSTVRPVYNEMHRDTFMC